MSSSRTLAGNGTIASLAHPEDRHGAHLRDDTCPRRSHFLRRPFGAARCRDRNASHDADLCSGRGTRRSSSFRARCCPDGTRETMPLVQWTSSDWFNGPAPAKRRRPSPRPISRSPVITRPTRPSSEGQSSNQPSGSFCPFRACQLSTRASAKGSASMARSSARAGPCGRRRPSSQFRSVSTLMPTSRANSRCVAPNFARMWRTSIGSNSTLAWPRRARLRGCFTCASGSAIGFRSRTI